MLEVSDWVDCSGYEPKTIALEWQKACTILCSRCFVLFWNLRQYLLTPLLLLPGVDVTRQGSLVRILDWHHVAWCVKTWALTTLNMSIIKSSANLQNPPFSLQTPRENHRDRSSEVQKSWIAQIFWPGNSQFVLTRRKSVSSISFWWQVQFPLVTKLLEAWT